MIYIDIESKNKERKSIKSIIGKLSYLRARDV